MENKELIFTIMVTSPDLLEREIRNYNDFFKTDFEIIEIIDDEVPFCKLKVAEYTMANIFGLGYSLALFEERLRKKGEIDW
ncbi:hypothetical protein AGMMS50239_41040 [Bacteroidia bacterium]|nr:hypothetical protein AGMMS50239_41040 [Bacteroidia bacterium]